MDKTLLVLLAEAWKSGERADVLALVELDMVHVVHVALEVRAGECRVFSFRATRNAFGHSVERLIPFIVALESHDDVQHQIPPEIAEVEVMSSCWPSGTT